MRITVCTFWTPEIALYAEWTTENKRLYAEKHGYRFVCPPERRSDRPPAWEKVQIISDALDLAEWVWWLDADAIVTNFETKLEPLLHPNFDFVIAKDFNGINTGSFLIRSNDWAKRFLWQAWRLEQYIHHGWWEQAAIMELMQHEENHLRTLFVEQRLLQSYPEWWAPGDFVLHVPARPTEERAAILADAARRAAQAEGGAS